MRAAFRFVDLLCSSGQIDQTHRISCELFGSLGHTGKGHKSDTAILMGLEGGRPDRLDPKTIAERVKSIRDSKQVRLTAEKVIAFDEKTDLIFHRRKTLPLHPNGMQFRAFGPDGILIRKAIYYSIGGGFVVNDADGQIVQVSTGCVELPFAFATGKELLALCRTHDLSISALMLENEKVWRTEAQVREGLLEIWDAMKFCIEQGCRNEGILPGGLKVKRRAPAMYRQLMAEKDTNDDPLLVMDWVTLYALAINEENAAGGRVVTAPTNGAAGIIPAVLMYYRQFGGRASDDATVVFLLTAAAIGILYKINASISGAEVGCQGEVGVACSMAAAGLAAVMGGTSEQIENAAEVGMEHNLGLTCDPVGGLVQIPCIERNAIGAVKAINAARMALRGDGEHRVSLDQVIKTMRDTGADMKLKYKETARGGLAVNMTEC